MKKVDEFAIPFHGLEPGKYEYEFKINREFFEAIETDLYQNADIDVKATMHKTSTMLSFDFEMNGTMEAECYRCTESSKIPLKSKTEKFFVAKIGTENSSESSDEIVVLSHGENVINIAQQVFEFFHSKVPLSILPCELNNNYEICNQEVLDKLNSVSIKKEPNDADPRWNALKNLKNLDN